MKQRALVPLDRSRRSEVALDGLGILCRPGDEVVLLSIDTPARPLQGDARPGRVIVLGITGSGGGGLTYDSAPETPAYTETGDQALQRQLDELQDYLHSKAAALEGAGFKVQLVVEVSEHPAEAIIETARKVKPTVILMARSTHHSVGERIFGTVPQHVIRENIAPVMVLPVPDELAE